MKKTYIVAVGQLQGLRKQPFDGNDEVVPANFTAGHFETLIEKGFIKEKTEGNVAEKVEDKIVDVADTNEASEQNLENGEEASEAKTENKPKRR